MTEEMPIGDIIATALINQELEGLSDEDLHLLAQIQWANDPDVSFDPEDLESLEEWEAGLDYHGSNEEDEMNWTFDESNPLEWEVENEEQEEVVVQPPPSFEPDPIIPPPLPPLVSVNPPELIPPPYPTSNPTPPRWNIFVIAGLIFAAGCIAAAIYMGVR